MPRHPPNALKTLDRSHCQCPPRRFGTASTEKTSFSRLVRWPRLGWPIKVQAIERCLRHAAPWQRPNKSSLYDVIQNRQPITAANFFHSRMMHIRHQHRLGGAERDRTADPLLAKQVLSQLSYSPIFRRRQDKWWAWIDSNYRPHPYQGCALTT
jgi:hypothetical protein